VPEGNNATAVSAVNTFSLRPGVSAAEFEAFSAELDRPTCLAFDVVQSFEVYLVESAGDPDRGPAIDVVEIMTVRSWPEWETLRDNAPEFKPVLSRFDELVQPGSVSTHLTRCISHVQEH
jgi:hypothetical protein